MKKAKKTKSWKEIIKESAELKRLREQERELHNKYGYNKTIGL